MPKFIDLTGHEYWRLKVVARSRKVRSPVHWECECECGNTTTVAVGNLRSGHTRSCGNCDLAGQRFGRLLVVCKATDVGARYTSWLCACDCGVTSEILTGNLNNGTSRSCGCLKREVASKRFLTHGHSGTPTHGCWMAMRQRCINPNANGYAHYGARGIAVCDRWLESFENFLADMGERPSLRHSIDRYPNNDGNYEPGNCRWATKTEQMRNTRATKLTHQLVQEIHGRREHGEAVKSIAHRLGLHQGSVYNVLAGATWRDQKDGYA